MLGAWAAFGQPAASAPAFEVASVKPSQPDARGSTFNFTTGGGLTVQNGTLRGIIEMAYDVRDFQISGGPAWLDTAHYDLFAKSAASDPLMQTATRQERIAESRRRLQTLLAERFQLKVHRETKQLPVFALVVGKNGSKLKNLADAAADAGGGINSGCGRMTGTRTQMANLALVLSRQLGRPVLDRTELAGRYDFQMEWTPDNGPRAAPAEGGSPGAGSSADGPSIFTALQEQLGLKLDSTKAPVEIVVVDHAEKAEGN
jgi:bla regulator protein blaR1